MMIKFKNNLIAKETINRVKTEPMKWEKIFAKHISDEELISKKYKKFLQINSKKNPINPIFEIGQRT